MNFIEIVTIFNYIASIDVFSLIWLEITGQPTQLKVNSFTSIFQGFDRSYGKTILPFCVSLTYTDESGFTFRIQNSTH